MRLSPSLVVAFVSLVGIGSARADDEIVARLAADTGASYSFAEYLPPGYDAEPDDAFHPLVVFLHGAGERAPAAADATLVIDRATTHGPLRWLERGDATRGDRQLAEAGAIVLAPIATSEDGWWNADKLERFLAYAVATYRVDWRRVYVTGISMGGAGTFMVGDRHGARVTAYIPICPAGTANGTSYTESPLWAFHSITDGVVGVGNTWTSMDRIADARAGSDVPALQPTYPGATADHTATFDGDSFAWSDGRDTSGTSPLRATIYDDGSHDSWTRTYEDDAVWTWLLAWQRPIPAPFDETTTFVDAVHQDVELTGEWTHDDAGAGWFFWNAATAPAGATATLPLRNDDDGVYEVWLSEVVIAGAAPITVTISSDRGTEIVERAVPTESGFVSLGTFEIEGAGTVTIAGDGDGTIVLDAIAVERVGDLPVSEVDAGMAIEDDAAIAGDAGAVDAGPRTDAGPRADGGSSSAGMTGSCACRAGSASSSLPTWSLALAALAVWTAGRRRARRVSTGSRQVR